MTKKFLMIDTSGEDSFVALHHPFGELEVEKLPSLKQSQTLLPALKKLLKAADSIEFIAVGIGPGSFTGTRVGVMTAKALSFSKKIPLLPFCSLKRYLPEREGPFEISVSAKSQGFYVLKGIRQPSVIEFEHPSIQKEKDTEDTFPLNLSALASYLLQKWEDEKGSCPHAIQVSYLGSSIK